MSHWYHKEVATDDRQREIDEPQDWKEYRWSHATNHERRHRRTGDAQAAKKNVTGTQPRERRQHIKPFEPQLSCALQIGSGGQDAVAADKTENLHGERAERHQVDNAEEPHEQPGGQR